MPIRTLPIDVVNKIAAGEVVDRPASAVKELLENSIDAQARSITVEVGEGGRDLIRVVDDGIGISADELVLAIAPHATSKLQSSDDLFRIRTLGFRGEALASIAAVSDFRLQSRPKDQECGAGIVVRHGEVGPVEAVGCPVGAQIEARNLFASVPVRRKFLKTRQTELAHVVETVLRLALVHPGISLTLIHNGRTLYERPADLDRLRTVELFFGEEVASGLVSFAEEHDGIKLEGLLALPHVDRPNAQGQYLFVNGRFIRDRSLAHALMEGYRGLLMTGRYPQAFLFFDIPPDSVDVNVHPTKTEVRFRDPHQLYGRLLSAVRRRFLSADLSPKLAPRRAAHAPSVREESVREESVREESVRAIGGADTRAPIAAVGLRGEDLFSRRQRQAVTDRFSPSGGRPAADVPSVLARRSPAFSNDAHEPPTSEPPSSEPPSSEPPTSELGGRRWPGSAAELDAHAVFSTLPNRGADEALSGWHGGDGALETAPSVDQSISSDAPLNSVAGRPLQDGPAERAIQLHNAYLVAETEDGLLLVDQHALHERILFERLKEKVARGSIESQPLLIPEPVELSPIEAGTLLDHAATLASAGVVVEEFGPRVVLLRAYPAMLRRLAPKELLQDIVKHLERSDRAPDAAMVLEKLLHMLACKAAVKAGDPLTREEISDLLAQRHLVDDSHHCPHGRPTVLKLSLADLEKQFRRT